ncbi:oxidoreductase [Acrocarpospora pleiomorpha]|uniref:Oxidoreductase n=1 Tax=Acrocarpospora pleiomorpha TaxID=90975 RepID=A0A5M3Y0T3_9ACTN|nr:ferredoxin--NADP reductase [Acrocarpospora pleiomorpha]GES25769.1 oxidoreductase [Acrocarpospora pleiomorpha]
MTPSVEDHGTVLDTAPDTAPDTVPDMVPGVDLRVSRVIEETVDARSFILEPPAERAEQFRYKAGQFLTIKVPLPGGDVARCYSLASAPSVDTHLKVTVKRTAGGAASGWLVDNVRPGWRIRALRPAGTFTLRERPGDVVLVAAGSGITPVIAIAKEALVAGDRSVRLFYANRDDASTIFREELLKLSARYGDRFAVEMWQEIHHGRVPHVDDLVAFLDRRSGGQYLVCGPAPFMDLAFQALGRAGVPSEAIHSERYETTSAYPFTPRRPGGTEQSAPQGSGADTQLEVTLDGATSTHAWPADKVLLDVLLDAGLDAPYSCREGNCSACACVVLDGSVRMRNNQVLDEADLADGLVLGCQALPDAPAVTISFDA